MENLKSFLRQPCWTGRSVTDPNKELSSPGGQTGFSGYPKGHVPKLKQVNGTLKVEDNKAEPDS